ncbi:MAG: four helix bundle protein [Anaerolineales bacterium]|nr:four helix bundle protein [Anaerolineales bacterium]MCB9128264.1 four helix bundle protein [Ardenticatenales bacterium]
MPKIERFEDIKAWQLARYLCKEIYAVTGKGSFSKDWSLRDQIRRAGLSIMLNIAEGFARQSNREFRQFLYVAHGSVAEVQSALYVAKDQTYITDDDFRNIYRQAEDISRALAGFIRYLGSTID